MNFKKSFLAIAMATSLAGAIGAASAQEVVIDPVNIQQNLINHVADIAKYVQMIQRMESQLQQLQRTYSQLKSQYKSLTGSRGLGMIDNEDFARDIPTNWRQTLEAEESGGQIGQIANQIRQEASELQKPYFQNVDSLIRQGLATTMDQSVNGEALNAQVYNTSSDRFQKINQLMQQINATTDMKGIAEIQARLQAENAQLLNELIRIQAMNAMIAQQKKVQQQKERQQYYQYYHAAY